MPRLISSVFYGMQEKGIFHRANSYFFCGLKYPMAIPLIASTPLCESSDTRELRYSRASKQVKTDDFQQLLALEDSKYDYTLVLIVIYGK
jgi:hypothetical protein